MAMAILRVDRAGAVVIRKARRLACLGGKSDQVQYRMHDYARAPTRALAYARDKGEP